MLFGRGVRTDDAGHRTLVGNREGLITEPCRHRDEFLGMRSAAQESEIAQRVQFGVARLAARLRRAVHQPKMPCRYQAALRLRLRYTHRRTPLGLTAV